MLRDRPAVSTIVNRPDPFRVTIPSAGHEVHDAMRNVSGLAHLGKKTVHVDVITMNLLQDLNETHRYTVTYLDNGHFKVRKTVGMFSRSRSSNYHFFRIFP